MTWFLKRFPLLVVLVVSCMLLLNLLHPMSVFAQTNQGQVSTQSGDSGPLKQSERDTINEIITELQSAANTLVEDERPISTGCYEDKSVSPTKFYCHAELQEVHQKVSMLVKHRQDEIQQLNDILGLPQVSRKDLDKIIHEFEQDATDAHDAATAIIVVGGVGCAALTETVIGGAICGGVIATIAYAVNSQADYDTKRATRLQRIHDDISSQEES